MSGQPVPGSGTDLCRKGSQRKPGIFSKNFPSFLQQTNCWGLPSAALAEKHMCSWVSVSESHPDLHGGQRWGKSASTDSHTNFTWDDVSRAGLRTACFENTQPMSLTYTFILNINLPAPHNAHSWLISLVRLEDIGNFL